MPEEILEKRPQQSNKSLMWVIAILLVLVIATGAYIMVSRDAATKDESSTEQSVEADDSATEVDSSTTTDETADWKTYTNDTYGFSLKYPESWVTMDDSNAHSIIWINNASENATDRIAINHYSSLEEFVKLGSGTNSGSTINDLLTNPGWVNANPATVTVSGITSNQLLEGAAGGNNLDVIVPKDSSNVFLIQFIESDKSSLNSTENQILSTFQFTK